MVTEKTTEIKKARMIEALTSSLGVITPACEMAQISRQTYYTWLKEDSQFRDDVENIKEQSIDFAVTSLLTQIKEKNTTATIFFLKTIGKGRGFIESTTSAISVVDDLRGKTQEELMDIIKTLDQQINETE